MDHSGGILLFSAIFALACGLPHNRTIGHAPETVEQDPARSGFLALVCGMHHNTSTEHAPEKVEENPAPSGYDRVMRPAKAIAAAYEASRQRIHDWMGEPRSTVYVIPALIGGCSAMLVIVSFYTLRRTVNGCRSRRRKNQIAKITDQLGDGKKLIECKPEESDNDLI